MNNWRETTLKEICDISIGRTPPRKEKKWFSLSKGIPWISISDMGISKKYILNTKEYLTEEAVTKFKIPIIEKNTIILSFKMTVGRVCITDSKMLSNEAIAHLNNCKIETEFLYYYLKNFNYSSLSSTSSIVKSAVNSKILKEIPVFFPEDRETQKTIANFISIFDKKLELNIKKNNHLEKVSKTLFKSWFIDFDPVKAKAEGRSTGLKKEISDLFTDSFEDSEMGRIPRGWRVTNISEIANIIDCLHSKKPKLRDEGFNFLELKNIRDDLLLETNDISKISETDYQKWISRIEVCGGDLIITNVGRVGAVARVPDKFKGAIGRNITAIRPKNKNENSFFLASYFSSQLFLSEKRLNIDNGTILDALNVKNIPKLRFFYPPKKILSFFETNLSSIWKRRELLLEENINLSKIRDTLIPKLISGKLKIKDVSNFLEKESV